MNLDSANLILRTSVLTAPDKSTTLPIYTWRNVNMKLVLGSLYDKYDKFKICLASIGHINNANITLNDRTVNLNMSGLMWSNRSYDSTALSSTNSTIIGSLLLGNSNGTAVNFTGEIGVMFNKPVSNLVDITLYYSRVQDGGIPTTTFSDGNSVYTFIIYGVDDKE